MLSSHLTCIHPTQSFQEVTKNLSYNASKIKMKNLQFYLLNSIFINKKTHMELNEGSRE